MMNKWMPSMMLLQQRILPDQQAADKDTASSTDATMLNTIQSLIDMDWKKYDDGKKAENKVGEASANDKAPSIAETDTELTIQDQSYKIPPATTVQTPVQHMN